MTRPHRSPRILAIDPGTRHMGVAVLAGGELAYYGVKSFRGERPADELIRATRSRLHRLIAHYQPAVIGYEKTFYVQSKNSALLQVQEGEIRRVGREAGLRVIGYAPTRVRSLLCQDGRATKQTVARVLSDRFPELRRYLATASRHQERYWLHMFDALAVGVVCAEAVETDATRNGRRPAAA